MDQTNKLTVLKNLKLAKYFTRKYPHWANGQLSDFEDRYQASALGLCIAVKKFDNRRKNKLSSYASHWIRCCMQRWCCDDLPVRIPLHIDYKMRSVLAAYRKLQTRKGDDAAVRYLHWAIDRYRLWHCWPIIGCNKVDNETVVSDSKCKIDIEGFDRLTSREQLVIRFRYGINTQPRTLDYIAENIICNISRERVRQIEESALRKLRGDK